MAKVIINVNIDPKEVLNILNKKLPAAKVDSSVYEVNGGKYIVNAVYEKTFMRGGDGNLIVTADNINNDFTSVKIVTTGMARDSGFTMGHDGKFTRIVKKALEEYVIGKN